MTGPKTFLLGAALIMAHQVAGKAVRDGLFLSQFPAADLPKIMAAAAMFSIVLGLAFARRMSRLGPMRVVPAAFAIGGLLHWIESGRPGSWRAASRCP
jgi:AAA family ATP:ADP antiporter